MLDRPGLWAGAHQRVDLAVIPDLPQRLARMRLDEVQQAGRRASASSYDRLGVPSRR